MSSNFEDTRFRYLLLYRATYICITCSSTLSTCALLGALMIVDVGVFARYSSTINAHPRSSQYSCECCVGICTSNT